LSLLGRGWELFKDFWSVLRPMRFCVLVWIAISSLIIIVPQSQDALLALLEDTVAATRAGLADAAVFAALVFLWAFQTFYWARFVSRLPPRPHPPYRYPPPLLSEARFEWWNRYLPLCARRTGAAVGVDRVVTLELGRAARFRRTAALVGAGARDHRRHRDL